MNIIKTVKTPKLKIRKDPKRSWESKVETYARKNRRKDKYSTLG
jgi:hypothetical protein